MKKKKAPFKNKEALETLAKSYILAIKAEIMEIGQGYVVVGRTSPAGKASLMYEKIKQLAPECFRGSVKSQWIQKLWLSMGVDIINGSPQEGIRIAVLLPKPQQEEPL